MSLLRRRPLHAFVAVAATMLMLATSLLVVSPDASAQLPLYINEVMASNESFTDNYGATPDYIEIQNFGPNVNLTGWSLSDSDGNVWPMPAQVISSGTRILIWASDRNEYSPALHANFSLKVAGETITLSEPNGSIVSQVAYPALATDQAYGRNSAGEYGYLQQPSPGGANGGLAPSIVEFSPAPRVFTNSSPLLVTLNANLDPGDTIRYTTNDSPVTASSPQYTGALSLSTSTIVRSAVVSSAGIVGPEVSGGYTQISSTLASQTSNLPMVLVHARGSVETDTITDAIVTIIDVDPLSGRASLSGTPNYSGFAGMRRRGASSAAFPKKQFKFETWGDANGTEDDVNLLGMGAESDWSLYAPGVYDRALINNPLMYELAKQIGVVAPDYRLVELWTESNESGTVGTGDYQGIYVLRETIEIDARRVDINPTAGVVLRYDWGDSCCANIKLIQNIYPSRTPTLEIADPNDANLSPGVLSSTITWWDQLETAARSGSFANVDAYIDFDSYIDHWLLEMLAMDVDVLRASHYMHRDAFGQLQGGPMWDYDRSMGAADSRVNDISEAQAWEPNGNSGHSWNGYIYQDVWAMPEVQALIRSRWNELRSTTLSDANVSSLVYGIGGQLAEAYPREIGRWNGNVDGYNYGPRFGGGNSGLDGELNHMDSWLSTRLDWLDDQFLSTSSPPSVTNPGTLTAAQGAPVAWTIQATDSQSMVFSVNDLPEGLDIDPLTGVISGVVPFGDGGTFPTTVTVTDSSGASTVVNFTISAPSPVVGSPAVLLNEYNAVDPGDFLDFGGSDSTFGTVSGNGGDWFELVVLQDELDLRNWTVQGYSNNAVGDVVPNTLLRFADDARLSNLRAGTIITISESQPDDLSYDPFNDDWTMNLQANAANDGALMSLQGNFDTNNKKWRLVVRDVLGRVKAEPAGETDPWDAANFGVSGREVLALTEDPSTSVSPINDYDDLTDSTFGAPNPGQNFDSIRPDLVMLGDVDCSNSLSLLDARKIALYAIGSHTDGGTCPLPNPSTQLYLAVADVDGSGSAGLLDSRSVALCAIGAPNPLCP